MGVDNIANAVSKMVGNINDKTQGFGNNSKFSISKSEIAMAMGDESPIWHLVLRVFSSVHLIDQSHLESYETEAREKGLPILNKCLEKLKSLGDGAQDKEILFEVENAGGMLVKVTLFNKNHDQGVYLQVGDKDPVRVSNGRLQDMRNFIWPKAS